MYIVVTAWLLIMKTEVSRDFQAIYVYLRNDTDVAVFLLVPETYRY